MEYGKRPVELGLFEIECREMMFYQYLPIKMAGDVNPIYEDRLKIFDKLVGAVCCDYIGEFGLDSYVDSYIYLTAKYLYVSPNNLINRPGWHSDGFLTDDKNYIWCDKFPTTFNSSNFNLTLDHVISMKEMEEQALIENNLVYKENQLLRLDQFNIHKVSEINDCGMRAFVKLSFSKDKYDLVGNSHNYELDYNWEMRERKIERNIPQLNK